MTLLLGKPHDAILLVQSAIFLELSGVGVEYSTLEQAVLHSTFTSAMKYP